MGYKNPLELRSWMLHAYTLLNLTSVSWREFSYVFARIDEGGLLENMPISRYKFSKLCIISRNLILPFLVLYSLTVEGIVMNASILRKHFIKNEICYTLFALPTYFRHNLIIY